MLLVTPELPSPAVPGVSGVLHVATPTTAGCITRHVGVLLVLLAVAPSLTALFPLFVVCGPPCCPLPVMEG